MYSPTTLCVMRIQVLSKAPLQAVLSQHQLCAFKIDSTSMYLMDSLSAAWPEFEPLSASVVIGLRSFAVCAARQ